MKTTIDQSARHVGGLADLPIDVAEAMYSPDFVELASIGAGGTPLTLPMSFSLDFNANCVRFSSPLAAGRLANYACDPRCAVLFSRVTTGHPPVLLQGIVTLGEVAEGVRRGPVRRFTVTPERLTVLDVIPHTWRLPGIVPSTGPVTTSPAASAQPGGRAGAGAPAIAADLDALVRFPTTVVTLRDREGRPLPLPAELRREGDTIAAVLPQIGELHPVPGPASLLGHTWTKDGPRYLALIGSSSAFQVPRSEFGLTAGGSEPGTRNLELVFHPSRTLRRP